MEALCHNEQIEYFGQLPTGEDIYKIHLRGKNLDVGILTYGAIVQEIRLDGVAHNLLLGFDDLETYLKQTHYVGAIVGQVANRIANGSTIFHGNRLSFDKNERQRTCLHGGKHGCSFLPWTIKICEPQMLALTCHLPHQHMGFPGAVDLAVIYRVQDDGLFEIELLAETDQPTLCNLASHLYFNLGGQKQILDDFLQIHADTYLPVSDDLIPLGAPAPVQDTPFDFRSIKTIGSLPTIDHNFCLTNKKGALRPAARLISPKSGISASISTTEPGLQVYSGEFTDQIQTANTANSFLPKNAGIALETQGWPDAPNHPDYPSIEISPIKPYRSITTYKFEKL